MQAISINQPFAHLIVDPLATAGTGMPPKRIENRSWTTSYRGPLLIHASKGRQRLADADLLRWPEMHFGAIIGACRLVDVEPYVDEKHVDDIWAEGPYCWRLEDVMKLDSPIEFSGRQRLFSVSHDIIPDDLFQHYFPMSG